MSDPSKSPPYLIDQILQAHQPHIMGGPSAAGKTRWLLETFVKWSRGVPVLGHTSHGGPWLYVNSDRNQEDLDEIIRSLGIPKHLVPTLPAWDLRLGYTGIIDHIQRVRPQLVIWEGFDHLAGDRANSFIVTNLLQRVSDDMLKLDFTLIGVNERPKMKPRDKYTNPRERISGPAAWARHAGTIFLLEFGVESNPDDPSRKFYVCSRHGGGNKTYEGAMTPDGHIVILDPSERVGCAT